MSSKGQTMTSKRPPHAARMHALDHGTADVTDVAWTVMKRKLARKLGRPLREEAGNSIARGLFGVALGVGVVAWQEPSLQVMVLVFGGYALVDGLLALCLVAAQRDHRWRRAGQAATSLAAAAFAFVYPDPSRTALMYVLAVWVVVMGALRLRDTITVGTTVAVRWVPAALAMLSIIAGCTVFVTPERGLLGLMINVAIFPILNGVTMISHARHENHDPQPAGANGATTSPAGVA